MRCRAARQDAVERGARRGRMLVGPRRREDDVPRAGVLELRDEPRHVERVDGLFEIAPPSVQVGGARRPVHADPERPREPVRRRARVAIRRVGRAERLRDAPPERLAEDRPLRRAADERLGVDPLQRLTGGKVDRPADASAALERDRVDPPQARPRREREAREARAAVERLHFDRVHAGRNHEIARQRLVAVERRAAERFELRGEDEGVRRILARKERGPSDGADRVRERERTQSVVPGRETALDRGGREAGVRLDPRKRIEVPVALRRLPDLLEDDAALVERIRFDPDFDGAVADGAALLVDRPRGARGEGNEKGGKDGENDLKLHGRKSRAAAAGERVGACFVTPGRRARRRSSRVRPGPRSSAGSAACSACSARSGPHGRPPGFRRSGARSARRRRRP